MRTADLRQREIINIQTAQRIGFVSDVEINTETGRVEALIVPMPRRICSIFGKQRNLSVPWEQIIMIGKDLILAELGNDGIIR